MREPRSDECDRLPDSWKWVRFGEFTRIANGQVDPREAQYADLPHIGPENIVSDTGRLRDIQAARQLELISGKYLFDDHAIVYSKIRPNLNKVAFPGFRGMCSADAYPIWPKNALSSAFLLQVMRSEPFRRQAVAASMRSGMPKINRPDLVRITIPFPPFCEQEAIGAVLATWDAQLNNLSDIIVVRRKMKRGLLQQFLTGRRRFPEFRKQRWRECRLRDIAEECNEPGRGTLGRERIMGVTKSRGIVPMEDRLIGNVDRYQIVRKDWFAYNPMRLNIGSIARSGNKAPVLVSPDYVVFRCKGDELDSAFLDQYRKGHLWESFMRVCGAGSVRVRIYFNDLGRHKMHIPPIEEQRRIAEALGTLDDELSQLRQLHDALKEQKKGLMQKLLTGKVRVPASMLKEAAR